MANIQFQLRRGLASVWTSVDPILAAGEVGVETDTNKIKIGNGLSGWTSLSYAIGGASGASGITGPYVTTFNGLTGTVGLSAGTGINLSTSGNTLTISATAVSGITSAVLSIRGLTGIVGLSAGTGIDISTSGNTLIISSTVLGACAGVQSFNGLTGAVTGVASATGGSGIFITPSGGTGNITVTNTGVTGIQGGTGISVSSTTGNPTITNTGVQLFNGLTGSVTGVTVGGTNVFTALNSFNAGISAAGGTFSGLIRANAGISASGGITLSGTLQGTTAAFTGLVSSTIGFSGPGTNITGVVTTFNNQTGAVTGVSTVRGLTGTVGLAALSGVSLSNTGNTLTFTNTGVLFINSSEIGNVINVPKTDAVNIFTQSQQFTQGILIDTNPSSSNGGLTADFNKNTIYRPTLQWYNEPYAGITGVSGGTITLDLSKAQVFVVTLDTFIASITISNATTTVPSRSIGFTLILKITTAAATIGDWGTIKWQDGVSPILSTGPGKTDVFSFVSYDNAASWLGFVGGQNYST